MTSAPSFDEILFALRRAGVEFIVVGMGSAVLQGVPTTTFDIDIVHQRSEDNVRRLVDVLTDLEAVFRTDRRGIAPKASHLVGPGHALLETKYGELDCLGTIDGEQTYESLLASTEVLDLGEGIQIRVVSIATLIEIKRRAGRPKDLAVIPLLEAALQEVRRRGE
jgi:hypothetical protein